jgi:hypothetical protein
MGHPTPFSRTFSDVSTGEESPVRGLLQLVLVGLDQPARRLQDGQPVQHHSINQSINPEAPTTQSN